MGYEFVSEPLATAEEKPALSRLEEYNTYLLELQRYNRSGGAALNTHKPSKKPSPVEPLTPEEESAINRYYEKYKLFQSTHHEVFEEPSEEQQASYIERHRGGVVFPWDRGTSAQDTEQAWRKISEIKAGTYRKGAEINGVVVKGAGELYTFESFMHDVIQELKIKPKRGWVRNS